MAVTASMLRSTLAPAGVFQADIAALDKAGGLTVEWSCRGAVERDTANAVWCPGWQPVAGERVLVSAGEDGRLYVLGPLDRPRQTALPLTGGAVAACDADGGLTVRDAADRVLFRFHAGDGSLSIEQPDLDLRLRARSLDLEAPGPVRIAGQRVDLVGADRVRATVAGSADSDASVLGLERGGARLEAGHLAFRAGSALARIGDMDWSGRLWRGTVDRAVVQARRVETSAEVIVQSARDVFQRLRGLHQVTAERMRHLINDTVQVKGKRVMVRATQAFKVRGDKIHLG